MKVMLSPFRFTTRYHLCCLPQQETHQRIPLLGDVSQPPVIGAGLLARNQPQIACDLPTAMKPFRSANRSEEHTSELQSLTNLVCRLLLEKKKKKKRKTNKRRQHGDI